MKKSNKKTFIVLFVVVLFAVGLLGYRNFIPGGSGGSSKVPCIGGAVVPAYHIHPLLKIIIDGKSVDIPSGIGLELLNCERVVHTHQEDLVNGFRQIHIEPDHYQEFTLGDFFDLWEKPFSAKQILDCKSNVEVDGTTGIRMTVDDQPNQEYENLILKDKQQIIIECGTVNRSGLMPGASSTL